MLQTLEARSLRRASFVFKHTRTLRPPQKPLPHISKRPITTLKYAKYPNRSLRPLSLHFPRVGRNLPISRGLASSATAPASVSIEHYHEQADTYIERVLSQAEALVEETDIPGHDAEYSAGVLTIIVPGKGTYVINKQPPNRQIWLSSPLSGPKRYDLVGGDEWLYLRDGSRLSDLLREELGFDMAAEDE